jgi:hypothetical protein
MLVRGTGLIGDDDTVQIRDGTLTAASWGRATVLAHWGSCASSDLDGNCGGAHLAAQGQLEDDRRVRDVADQAAAVAIVVEGDDSG